MRVALCGLALLITGCAGTAPPASPAAAAEPSYDQRVGLTEWDVVTSGVPLRAGDDVLTVTNAGTAPHDVVVLGEAGRWATRVLPPGERQVLRIRTVPGEVLDLWCSVPGHDAAGMRTQMRVAP